MDDNGRIVLYCVVLYCIVLCCIVLYCMPATELIVICTNATKKGICREFLFMKILPFFTVFCLYSNQSKSKATAC